MNAKKNHKLLLTAAVAIILSFNSCKKYEDGQILSLRTKTARLTGDWKALKVDGQKLSSSGNLLTLYLEQDRDLAIASSYYSINE